MGHFNIWAFVHPPCRLFSRSLEATWLPPALEEEASLEGSSLASLLHEASGHAASLEAPSTVSAEEPLGASRTYLSLCASVCLSDLGADRCKGCVYAPGARRQGGKGSVASTYLRAVLGKEGPVTGERERPGAPFYIDR